MKIERIHIEGFGHFTDRTFGPFSSPIYVFFGENEAGKSTLLAFIRTVLFGYPSRGRKDWYPALYGGRHGGSITIRADDGQLYMVERIDDNRGVSLRILLESGAESRDENLLARLLGHSTRTLFEAIFAFGLFELQKLENVTRGEVEPLIYSAGMGVTNLPAVMKSLASDAEEVFKKNGSNQDVAKILRDLEEIERNLKTADGDAAEYGRLAQRRDEIAGELKAQTEAIRIVDAALRELKRLQAAWDDWVQVNSLEAELRELPVIENFPENGVARLQKAEDQLASAREARDEAAIEVERAEERAQAPVPDEALLETAKTIEDIRGQRKRFDDSLRDLPKREAEVAAKEAEIATGLLELGPGWDTERLAAFEISAGVRSELDGWRKHLDETQTAAREAEHEVARARQALQEAAQAEEQARKRLEAQDRPKFDTAAIESRRADIRTARTQLNEYLRAKERRADREFQANQAPPPSAPIGAAPSRWPALALGGGGLALAAVGLLAGGAAAAIGVIAGLVLLAGAGVMYVTAKPAAPAVPEVLQTSVFNLRLEEARRAEESAQQALATAARNLGNGIPQAADLDRAEAELEPYAEAVRQWAELTRAAQAAREEVERRSKRAEECAVAHAGATEKHDSAAAGWREWLAVRSLSPSLMPDSVAAVFGDIRALKGKLGELAEARHRVDGINANIREDAERVAGLAARHNVAVRLDDPASVVRAAEDLVARFDSARKAADRREQARAEAAAARERLEKLDRRFAAARDSITELLQLGQSADTEEFRRRADVDARRSGAIAALRETELRLQKLSGPGEAYSSFRQQLAASSPQEFEPRITHLEEQRGELETKRQDLQREEGSVSTLLNQLVSDEHASEWRAERVMLVEQLDECARRWSKLVIARSLLERAQKKFEQERQPAVIREAASVLATVTGGRYTRVTTPLGSDGIVVATNAGQVKTPAQLSQGTQEQLYLALRFGLIQQFAQQATNLPVIVDEVLVNFDQSRAQRAAQAFASLSETHQVLVFTCHRYVVDLFQSAAPGAEVIDLAGPQPQRLID